VKTLLSAQWQVFYLALLIGLITGGLTALSAASMVGDPMSKGPMFFAELAVVAVLLVGLPHYILFKVALRRSEHAWRRAAAGGVTELVASSVTPFTSTVLVHPVTGRR